MIKLTKETMYQFATMLENGTMTDSIRDLLGQSLFYYCSGKDPTPIAAFGAKTPLYVYVDINKDFVTGTQELYDRLKNLNFYHIESHALRTTGRLQKAKNAELTLWNTDKGESFILLFVQGDAIEGFKSIYTDSINYIQPKCICNCRYELNDLDVFYQLEKRVEYILGHCYNPKYRCIQEYDYLGDYASFKVGLFHRFFYYLY